MPACKKLAGPWRITFDTNPYLCNLRCIFCEVHSIYNRNRPRSSEAIMDPEIIRRVISSAYPYGLKEVIPSTMGEPLLYPHFDVFIEMAKKYNVKINLTTNGTFPIRGVDKWGYLILPVASDVKISINGATKRTAESIMVGIDFEKQLRNIERFIEIRDEIRKEGINNPTITFQVVYMESNLEELPELLKMAIDMGADRFKGHHLWITWPQLREESLRRNTDARKRWNNIVDKLYEIRDSYRGPNNKKIKLDNVYKLPLEIKDSLIPDDWVCPFVGREAWIAWDGTFNVCCAPDNLRKTFGYFGNVSKTDFMKLWNSKKYNKFVENWGNYSVCKLCNMRRPRKDIRGCENGVIN